MSNFPSSFYQLCSLPAFQELVSLEMSPRLLRPFFEACLAVSFLSSHPVFAAYYNTIKFVDGRYNPATVQLNSSQPLKVTLASSRPFWKKTLRTFQAPREQGTVEKWLLWSIKLTEIFFSCAVKKNDSVFFWTQVGERNFSNRENWKYISTSQNSTSKLEATLVYQKYFCCHRYLLQF